MEGDDAAHDFDNKHALSYQKVDFVKEGMLSIVMAYRPPPKYSIKASSIHWHVHEPGHVRNGIVDCALCHLNTPILLPIDNRKRIYSKFRRYIVGFFQLHRLPSDKFGTRKKNNNSSQLQSVYLYAIVDRMYSECGMRNAECEKAGEKRSTVTYEIAARFDFPLSTREFVSCAFNLLLLYYWYKIDFCCTLSDDIHRNGTSTLPINQQTTRHSLSLFFSLFRSLALSPLSPIRPMNVQNKCRRN